MKHSHNKDTLAQHIAIKNNNMSGILTKDMEHECGAVLRYLVGCSADVLSKICSDYRVYGQLTAIGVKTMMGGVEGHRPRNAK